MEAFGFYTAALATATLEFIHVFKVVSDNASDSLEDKLDKDTISDRIASHLDSIERFAQATLKNRPGDKASDWVEGTRLKIQSIHHLSSTDKHKLAKKLKPLSHLMTDGEKKVFSDQNRGSMAEDRDENPVLLVRNRWELDRLERNFPEITFSTVRERS